MVTILKDKKIQIKNCVNECEHTFTFWLLITLFLQYLCSFSYVIFWIQGRSAAASFILQFMILFSTHTNTQTQLRSTGCDVRRQADSSEVYSADEQTVFPLRRCWNIHVCVAAETKATTTTAARSGSSSCISPASVIQTLHCSSSSFIPLMWSAFFYIQSLCIDDYIRLTE